MAANVKTMDDLSEKKRKRSRQNIKLMDIKPKMRLTFILSLNDLFTKLRIANRAQTISVPKYRMKIKL